MTIVPTLVQDLTNFFDCRNEISLRDFQIFIAARMADASYDSGVFEEAMAILSSARDEKDPPKFRKECKCP